MVVVEEVVEVLVRGGRASRSRIGFSRGVAVVLCGYVSIIHYLYPLPLSPSPSPSSRDRTAIDTNATDVFQELSPTSSIQSTPNAPTPTSGNLPPASARASDHPTPTSATSLKAGGNKKNKKGVEREDEESEGKQPKRLKITYARGGVGGE